MAFIAALHNTTTDEIEGFDLDLPEETARARWARLQRCSRSPATRCAAPAH